MKKLLTIGLLFLFVGILAQNKAYQVSDIPLVHLQNKTRYVSNPDNLLSNQAVHIIDTTLYALERQTGVQVMVVAVKNIEGEDCTEFAYQLGIRNGVGQKEKDNGLVILLVTEMRRIQFATGYGLEGVLPDAICKQIQVRHMNKYLKDGRWDEGMVAGIQAIKKQLDGTGDPLIGNGPIEDDELWIIGFTIFGIILLAGISAFTKSKRSRICPYCKKNTLKKVSSRIVSRQREYVIVETVRCCSSCGHVVRTQERITDDDHHNHRNPRGGIFFGGFPTGFGGGGRGGDFSGGSYGGGDFGGGGSGSDF